jgi:Xaa-Pro aminopeptidase
VDRAARKVIEDAGYGKYFTHRLGHGLGMDGHEPPYLVRGNKKPLATGNVETIEPGIYIPDHFARADRGRLRGATGRTEEPLRCARAR